MLGQPSRPNAHVGNTLNFAARAVPLIVPASIVAGPWAQPSGSCNLDVASIARLGGIATVLAVKPDGVMLSLAQANARPAAKDCKGGETILLRNSDYANLVSAPSRKPG